MLNYSNWRFCIYLYYQLDIWKEASHPNENVDIHVKAEDISKVKLILKSNGIDFTVMINDVQDAIMKEALSNQKNAFNHGYNYNKYNEYSKVCRYFAVLFHFNFLELKSVKTVNVLTYIYMYLVQENYLRQSYLSFFLFGSYSGVTSE